MKNRWDTWQDTADFIHFKGKYNQHQKLFMHNWWKQMNLPLSWGLLWKTYLWYTGTLYINEMALTHYIEETELYQSILNIEVWSLQWKNHLMLGTSLVYLLGRPSILGWNTRTRRVLSCKDKGFRFGRQYFRAILISYQAYLNQILCNYSWFSVNIDEHSVGIH